MAQTQDVVTRFVRVLIPPDQPTYLRDHGIRELGLSAINTHLAPHGLILMARKVRDARCFVACTDQHGQPEPYGLFELLSLEPDGSTDRDPLP